MSKINNKVLVIIIIVLAGIYLGKKFLGSSGERNFRDVLVSIDTALVDKIVIEPKAGGETITFSKVEAKWQVTQGGKSDEADAGTIGSMLTSMVDMKPKRLVAVSSDKWDKYEVNDSLGIKVKAYQNDDVLSDFVVGKFNFQPNSRSMSTYMRLSEDDQVYSVEGFLSSSYDQEFNSFRDKTFLNLVKENIENITYSYPGDSSFTLSKNADNWLAGNLVADSTLTAKYLQGLERLNKREFKDDFNPDNALSVYRMAIALSTGSTVDINCYADGEDYILHSSLNADAYFEKGSTDIFSKLFIAPDELVKKELVVE